MVRMMIVILALESSSLVRGSQHYREKSAGLMGQIIIKIKKRSKRLPIQPADILVIGTLADDRLDKGSPIEAHHDQKIMAQPITIPNISCRYDPDDVAVDKDPSNRCQGSRNDRNDSLIKSVKR